MNKSYVNRKDLETLAGIIDMPQDQFEKEVIDHKVNVGQMHSLTLFFEGTYAQCRASKDALINLVTSKQKTEKEVKPTLEGLYAEMTKIEMKVTFLKNRRKELIKSVETPD